MKSRVTGVALLGLVPLSLVLAGYTAGPVTNGGTISGTIRLAGAAPRLESHRVTDATQQPACSTTVQNDEVVTGTGGTLANAVVWIDGIQAGAATKRASLTLDQRGCRYLPRVQAAAAGSQVTITSSDATLHNVHGRVGKRTLFNLAMPAKGMRIARPLARPGVVDIKCDAGHTWMRAWVHVFDHPYFAVTAADGRFQLPNVPPGRHTVKVWHERFAAQTRQLDVTAGGTATWDISMR